MSAEKLQTSENQRRRTAGERLFEEYLRSQGIKDFEYEKEHTGKRKKPDYTVTLDREYLFDIKDFTYVDVGSGGSYDPYKRLRAKIGELREQFREYKDCPCCGVLYNDNAPLVDLTTPMIVHGAMYGDLGMTMQINTVAGGVVEGSEREEFLSRGKMLMRSMKKKTAEVRNSTISALITLRQVRTGYARLCNDLRDREQERPGLELGEWLGASRDFDTEEEHLGVIVWENIFALNPSGEEVGDRIVNVDYAVLEVLQDARELYGLVPLVEQPTEKVVVRACRLGDDETVAHAMRMEKRLAVRLAQD